jgi:hypothetical protein
VQVGLDRRSGDVHDVDVQDGEELAEKDDRKEQAAAPGRGLLDGRSLDHASTVVESRY